MDALSLFALVGWIGLHLAALATACVTRIAAGSCCEGVAQFCFFAAMTAVGATAWICQQLDVTWTWSGITLMVMVLTAVVDFRRMSEPAQAAVSR